MKCSVVKDGVAQVLEGLNLTSDQFVDLCILCGCDYCGTIKGMVPLWQLIPALRMTNRVLNSAHVNVFID